MAPGTNIFDALVQAAVSLRSGAIVVGESEVMTPERQAMLVGEAWDRTPHDLELATRFVVLCKDGASRRFSLGAHTPDLSPLTSIDSYKIRVEAVKAGPDIHHAMCRDGGARRTEHDLHSGRRQEAIERLRSKITSP